MRMLISRSQGGKVNTSSPTSPRRKTKAAVVLCGGTLVLSFLVDLFSAGSIAEDRQLLTRCKSMSDLLAESGGDLSKFLADTGNRNLEHYSVKDVYQRILELGDEDPCITDFPVDAEEYAADDEIIDRVGNEPMFDVAPEYYEEEFMAQEVDGVIDIVPESKPGDIALDIAETSLVESFVPQVYEPIVDEKDESDADANTIAYVVPLTGCPEWYRPPVDDTGEPLLANDLYEASAVIKAQCCDVSEKAEEGQRKLRLTLAPIAPEDAIPAADMDYQMHAIIHPLSTECPVPGSSEETYDRVKLMQSLNYDVEIMGHPITQDRLLEGGQEYLRMHIEDEVGIRDSTKLHAWRLTLHPAVILMDFNTVLNDSLHDEVDELLADDDLKGMYITTAGGIGVDTGLMIIKPSEEEFDRIVDTYVNTMYYPETGWNGQGYNNFEGSMGISGFLAYYFANDPGYTMLNRCKYAHTADDDCNNELNYNVSKASKIRDDVCGNPRDCPYNHPNWSNKKKKACQDLHHRYYESRYKFEENYFNKKSKQERIGMFKPKSFLGYCTGPGKKHFLSMTQSKVNKPDWLIICPPDAMCPEGSLMKNDCTCTTLNEDPCSACPENTFCQTEPSLMCIDCNCGFCDATGLACCRIDTAKNNCTPGPGDNKDCVMQNDFFLAFSGEGNVCGGVEVSANAVPNGCGCKPNSVTPCMYSREWGEETNRNTKCFICTADDIALGICNDCKDCIRSACPDASSCMDSASTASQFSNCLKRLKKDGEECRASCHQKCLK